MPATPALMLISLSRSLTLYPYTTSIQTARFATGFGPSHPMETEHMMSTSQSKARDAKGREKDVLVSLAHIANTTRLQYQRGKVWPGLTEN